MAHIHDLIDFAVSAYIVYKKHVLLIHHKEHKQWLPIGGHIESNENPEQALFREIEEETSLTKDKLVVLSNKPNYKTANQQFLYTPNLLDFHKINDSHKHVGIIFFLTTKTSKVKLEKDHHYEIRWFSESNLNETKYKIRADLIYAATKAIKVANSHK